MTPKAILALLSERCRQLRLAANETQASLARARPRQPRHAAALRAHRPDQHRRPRPDRFCARTRPGFRLVLLPAPPAAKHHARRTGAPAVRPPRKRASRTPRPCGLTFISANACVGALSEINGQTFFQYDDGFLRSGMELSPLHLPLGPGVRRCSKPFLLNLPGLCYDSLPDDWGQLIMERWFRQERRQAAVTPLEQLCFVGDRGVGALRYEPALLADDPLKPAVARGARSAPDRTGVAHPAVRPAG